MLTTTTTITTTTKVQQKNKSNNIINQNISIMTQSNQNLQEFYLKLPNKMKWAVDIAKQCKRSVSCIRMWGLGTSKTSDEKCLTILEGKTKIPKDRLFSHLTD